CGVIMCRTMPPPTPTLISYTTLFRSNPRVPGALRRRARCCGRGRRAVVSGPSLTRARYAALYGPTVGDRIRLADTDLLIEVEERSEEHTSELQSRENLVCGLLPEKKK